MNLKIETITSKVTSLTNSSLWMPFLVKHGKVSKYYEQHCKVFQKLRENYKKPLKSASQSICNVKICNTSRNSYCYAKLWFSLGYLTSGRQLSKVILIA